MSNILKIVAVSDIHFGNTRVNSEVIYLHLKQYLYPELDGCHLLIIAGDLFDRLVTVGSDAHQYASAFISDIFMHSHNTGMIIRILHGTYSHDRNQLSVFNYALLPNTRVKVIDEIYTEEISGFSGHGVSDTTFRVGYIPDNLPYHNSDEVLEQLGKVMTCSDYSNLDFLVGHGTFEHALLPNIPHLPPCTYDWRQFTKIVKGPIIMGHIHTRSHYHNVYYCGSFERLAHGEEEPKGFYRFNYDCDRHEWDAKFIVNYDATKFITMTLEEQDPTTVTNDFLKMMTETFGQSGGYVRILHRDLTIRTLLHRACAKYFPMVVYSSRLLGEPDTNAWVINESIDFDRAYEVKPDEHNLADLTYQFLVDNNMITTNVDKDTIVKMVNDMISNLKNRG